MPRDPLVYLQDILAAIERIQDYTQDVDLEGFRGDRRTSDAVLRNLEILGEAVKMVPESLRRRAPEIEWRKISGLRDLLAHAYFEVDLDIAWDVVRNKLPTLARAVKRLFETAEREERHG
ncbi:MAG: DUF86 domain-containing protein [Planctomycetota bacterium]